MTALNPVAWLPIGEAGIDLFPGDNNHCVCREEHKRRNFGSIPKLPCWETTPLHKQWAGKPGGRPLTPRELEVLSLVAQGKSALEIGTILAISKRTVDEHAATATKKLGAASRVHAVALAVRDGLIRI